METTSFDGHFPRRSRSPRRGTPTPMRSHSPSPRRRRRPAVNNAPPFARAPWRLRFEIPKPPPPPGWRGLNARYGSPALGCFTDISRPFGLTALCRSQHGHQCFLPHRGKCPATSPAENAAQPVINDQRSNSAFYRADALRTGHPTMFLRLQYGEGRASSGPSMENTEFPSAPI